MIFLLEYDRHAGRLVTIRDFETSQRGDAEASRREMELELNRRGLDHEVVLLEALNKVDLQRTHRRYFVDLHDLLESGTKNPDSADQREDT